MRKYWKLAATATIIVLILGSFYVHSAWSAETYPEFVIKTISGNADEIKGLVLDGAYTETSSESYVSTNLKITEEGSSYNSPSFLDRVIGQPPTVIKDYQENYRSFMRGKDPFVNWFFEDEKFLAYATVDYEKVDYEMGSLESRDFSFDISVLTKKDGETDSFTVKVPDNGELEYVFVDDVQKIGDELYLITRNTMRNGNKDDFKEEEHIYTIDLANQKVSSNEAIIQTPYGKNDVNVNVQLIESSPTKPNEHLILIKTEQKVIEDMESTKEEFLNQEIFSYNLATKERDTIDLPGMQLDDNQLSFFDGSTIYFTRLLGQELEVTPYHLGTKEVGKTYSIKLSSENGFAGGQMTTMKDGKIYIASSQMSPYLKMDADVIVANATTGETLFRGQIVLEDPSKEIGQFDLYLYEMLVK